MTVKTQQWVTLMFGGTLCLSVVISLLMLGAYGLKYDGAVADHILQILQTIVVTVVPSLAGLGGLHLWASSKNTTASGVTPNVANVGTGTATE